MLEQGPDTYFFKNNDEREVEKFVGIQVYATSKIEGIGGEYKKNFKDFIVREIESNGKILSIKEDYKITPFSDELKDKYTTFNLIKVNKDTFEAIRRISKDLKIPYNSFSYSGLKDKYSISVQKVSVKGDYIKQLSKLKINDIFIRSIYPTRKPVKLGSHLGNNFKITIRSIEAKKDLKTHIEEYIKFLNEFGFPNYFGLQRYGNYRPNSHIVGRYILEGDFEKAFKEFVSTTYSTESLESKTVRRELRNTGNFEKAYNDFPKSLKYERNMIEYLIDNPEDYEGSINTLPPDLIRLLISSFQSYLFNKMLSLRVEKNYPLFNPVEGDVLSILDDYNGRITLVKYIYGKSYDKYLEKALKLNRAAIIIPIIGTDTRLDEYPLMKLLYNETLKQENIRKDLFYNTLVLEQEYKGSIRAITAKPISLKILEFNVDELNPGKYKLKLEFSLQKGTYATMLIRELIK
ncbi:MAG: tRNA pseudouridine(13) synthase TruD [Promethearchaeota archaeon]|nr:MAG: tRNA pseudouridine(13) synthase TruD [Candidatus Lokiarchaeota archaeon]